MALAAAAYARQLLKLLPPGRLWMLESGSVLRNALTAVADELARVDGRAEDMLNESDPRTTDEMIEEWEAFVGLPDERITEIPGTLAARRIAVTQKLVSQGGQSASFFEALAAACGYTMTITQGPPDVLRSGFRCPARVRTTAWAYSMLVNVSAIAGSALTQAQFEAVIRAATHSHIQVMFDYP